MKKIDYNALRSAIDETIKADNWRVWWQKGWKIEAGSHGWDIVCRRRLFFASDFDFEVLAVAKILNLNIEDYVISRPTTYKEALEMFWATVKPQQELIEGSGIRVSDNCERFFIDGVSHDLEFYKKHDNLSKMVYYLFRLDLIDDYQLEVQP